MALSQAPTGPLLSFSLALTGYLWLSVAPTLASTGSLCHSLAYSGSLLLSLVLPRCRTFFKQVKQVSWENLTNDYLNIIWIYKDQIFSGLRTHGLEGGLVEPPVKAKSGFVPNGRMI